MLDRGVAVGRRSGGRCASAIGDATLYFSSNAIQFVRSDPPYFHWPPPTIAAFAGIRLEESSSLEGSKLNYLRQPGAPFLIVFEQRRDFVRSDT